MKKNVLIIGFGDIAKRISHIIKNNEYELYSISRGNQKSDIKNYIKWDWLSNEIPKLDITEYDSIIFIPKPSSFDEDGYKKGFINSSENVLSYKKFITISSTRVYGNNKSGIFMESDPLSEDDFRSKTLVNYENNQIKNYEKNLIILRFAGLYQTVSERKFANYLHRNNAANIIKFFIENEFNLEEHEIFNCAEDRNDEQGNISNSKLKSLGFIFDEYD
jgi:hypothetical protein